MSLRRRESSTAVVEEEDVFAEESTDAPTADVGTIPLGDGWEEAEEIGRSGNKLDRLDVNEEPILIKFISDRPISWKQHYSKVKGRPYTCIGDNCPICGTGDKPRARYLFTVADLSGDEPQLMKLEGGKRLLTAAAAVHKSSKGPLTANCMEITATNPGTTDVQFFLNVIKDRDLQEETGLDPKEVKAALADFEPLTKDAVFVPGIEELREAAKSFVQQ